MRFALAVLLVVHGLIHLFGVAKAFGLAMLPQLTRPISPGRGGLWSIAAALFVVSAGALYAAPRWWWLIALGAIAVSSVAIAGSWADAKAGAAVNLIVLVAAVVAAAIDGPWGLRSEYDRDIGAALARPRRPRC